MLVNSKITHCGIDFGTTNSSVAVSQNLQPQALTIDPASPNPHILKSLIYIGPDHQPITGNQAINRYLYDLEHLPSKPPRLVNTGRMIKTFGPSTPGGSGPPIWVPEIIEVDDSGRGRLLQSLKSTLTNRNFTGTEIFNKFYMVEDLLTILLSQIKTRAEISLNSRLDSAVIGRPVRYVGLGMAQTALDRMAQIARNAGFKHLKFEYEPVGAALNYGININHPQTILVFDFGGGTLDICLMSFPEKKLLAVSGRPIGGDLLNARLVESQLLYHFGSKAIINNKIDMPHHYYQAFSSWFQLSLLKSVKTIGLLQDLAIQSNQPDLITNFINLIINDYGFDFFKSVDSAKISLSSLPATTFSFNRPHLSFSQDLTRQEFELAIEEELIETKKCLDEAIHQSGLTSSQIDKVILTGGSSQIPVFLNLIHQLFPPEKIIASDYFTSVAMGLSIRAEQLFS